MNLGWTVSVEGVLVGGATLTIERESTAMSPAAALGDVIEERHRLATEVGVGHTTHITMDRIIP